MTKRLCSLALILLMLAGTASAAFSACDEWAKPELDTALTQGLVPAVLENADMTQPITRAEFAAVTVTLYETMSGTTVTADGAVAPTDTSDPDVLKACALGFTNGVGENKFLPDSPVARQDAATMLTRVYKKLHWRTWTLADDKNFSLNLSSIVFFADHDRIDDWARDAVYFMSGNGILKGNPIGDFMPHNNDNAAPVGTGTATRQEAILMALRMFQTLKP